jgi:AraC family transcriptional regulator of adaptative response/methylated-DNA-[protein]-cysteine methyltransferase
VPGGLNADLTSTPEFTAGKPVAARARSRQIAAMTALPLPTLPSDAEMYRAVAARDESYEGVFVAAIRTTGVFCRPGCPAKRPNPENVEYFGSVRDALAAGYRPCRRCQPLDPRGTQAPWVERLLARVEDDPDRRWRDRDLRAAGLDPDAVRRWFQRHHGMTFHAFQRMRRLGRAIGRIRLGEPVSRATYDAGFESESGFREACARLFGRPPTAAASGVPLHLTRLLTPLGPMVAAAVDGGVCLLEFADRPMLETQLRRLARRLTGDVVPEPHEHLERLDTELAEYFSGTRRAFSVPMVAPGSPFQTACWDYMRAIPFGETRSYDQEATAIGRPGAHRAVGRANGDNRIAILIPCHRVVRSDGQLAGYGGGKWRKQWLLDHEAGARVML